MSFERQKAVVFVHNVASGERRAIADFRGSNSAPAWSPDGQTAGRDALARGRLAALPRSARNGGEPRRLDHRARRSTPRPSTRADGRWLYFTSDRGGAPQIYRMPARRRRRRARHLQRQLQHQPGDQPGRHARSPTSRAQRQRLPPRTSSTCRRRARSRRSLTDTSDDEHPSFAPNGRLLIYATRAQGRTVLMTTTLDGKIKARLPSADGRSARAGVGPVRALSTRATAAQFSKQRKTP